MFKCNRCGEQFSEDEADTRVIDLEFECGMGGMFPDHHTRTIYICPECGTSDIDPYEEKEEEEEDWDDVEF